MVRLAASRSLAEKTPELRDKVKAGEFTLHTRVALHTSQQISSEFWGFSGVATVSHYTPPKGHLPLKRCRATGGGVAATLAGVALHSGAEKGVITKGVVSLEESLQSLESPENGQILLCFPQSGGSLESLDSQNSLESLENGLF